MANTASLFKTFALILTALYLYSCNSQVKDMPKGDSTAFFDYFTYTGEDDFYKNNPLPDNNHFYNPILQGWYSDPSICTN